ncbi:hypothetical protein GLW04_16935 [Halobacillus litoralis]|uniref:Transposase n=1 Tax=Halobacillus litoralis TaxID=45668 RepID=A0A845DZ44_9BACI|nr:hypothetical protein [Halobacillus litoralis]MYL21592.1 hypothetical protein [Halobacillus litoralis]
MDIVTIEELVPGNHLLLASERELERQIQTNAAYRERLGLHYSPSRGKEKGKAQPLMTAACRNMKKTALHPARVSWVKEGLFDFKEFPRSGAPFTPAEERVGRDRRAWVLRGSSGARPRKGKGLTLLAVKKKKSL